MYNKMQREIERRVWEQEQMNSHLTVHWVQLRCDQDMTKNLILNLTWEDSRVNPLLQLD